MASVFVVDGAQKFPWPATFPNRIFVGTGTARQVGREAKALGAKRALILCGRSVRKAGLVDLVREPLEVEKIRVEVFDGVAPEPTSRLGDECGRMVRQGGYDVVIGLGGGSSMDATKAASIMAVNEGKLLDYSVNPEVGPNLDLVPKKGIPMILLPTTAGSGSEASNGIAVRNEEDNTKRAVLSRFMQPDTVIVDPLLTVSVPPVVTADTGIDAFTHALEAYIARNRHPFTDVLALESMRLIAANLPTAYSQGTNIEARSQLSLAATMAGLCLTRGLTLLHGLSVFAGTKYNMTHGRAVAVMLPHVAAATMAGNPEKYKNIAEAMGEDVQGLPVLEAARKSLGAIQRLLDAVGISSRLMDYGASRRDLPELVRTAMGLPRRHFDNTPGDLKEADITNIFVDALSDGPSKGAQAQKEKR